jgi:iron complex transport system ATP-binding protein
MDLNEILRVEKLAFSYPTKTVFQDVSLSIYSGEILCLMGPNGCGKTTFIDNLMAIHKPDKGEIYLMGKALRNYTRREIAEVIAYVPQIHNITFPYTVMEVVMMGRTARLHPFENPDDNDEIECFEALKKVGIEDMADEPYNKLSGGEVKLVLLARALSQRTPLIIMDEPTAYLDFKNELVFLEIIAELCKKEKISVMMVTHSLNHPIYFSSKDIPVRGALMSNDTLYSYGDVHEVITEENIRKVYGVKAKICPVADEEDSKIQSITLLKTI